MRWPSDFMSGHSRTCVGGCFSNTAMTTASAGCPWPRCAPMQSTSSSVAVSSMKRATNVGPTYSTSLGFHTPSGGSPTLRNMPTSLHSLTLPAPVWPFLSSAVLLYCQPTLLHSLAQRMNWPATSVPLPLHAIHFSGYSAGSHTPLALEAEHRLLCQRLQQPMPQGVPQWVP